MCEELKSELDEALKCAKEMVEHLNNMGAEKCMYPITTDEGCFIVEVRRTL